MNIIFDVDETLYDMVQPFERAFKELWQDKYDIDMYALYAASRVHSDKVFDQVMAGTMTVDGAGVYRMTHAMEDFGFAITEEEALEFQHAYRKHQQHLNISETMEKILDLLKNRNVSLAILTNGDTDHQMEKIRGMGLERWFSDDKIFVSDTVGYFKPDVRTFRAVEQALDLNRDEIWYIGDSIENDVEGAGAAGWHMILLNRHHNDTSIIRHQPDYIVESEEELLEILKRIVGDL
mgnify:FL=1